MGGYPYLSIWHYLFTVQFSPCDVAKEIQKALLILLSYPTLVQEGWREISVTCIQVVLVYFCLGGQGRSKSGFVFLWTYRKVPKKNTYHRAVCPPPPPPSTLLHLFVLLIQPACII